MALISALASGIAGIISLVFGLIVYIFSALGFYTLAKRDGINHAWIAWIPICQWYLLGELIGDKIFGIGNMKWVLVLAPIVISILTFFIDSAMVAGILNFLVYLLEAAAYYKLFKIYDPSKAVLFIITGLIISPLLGIYTFAIRNKPRNEIAY